MSDASLRTAKTRLPDLAAYRSAVTRATLRFAGTARNAVVRFERAALWCRRGIGAAGPIGWAGLGTLLVAFVAAWSVLLPQQENLSALRERLLAAQSRSRDGAEQAASPARQSSEFLRRLPTRSDVPAILGVVLEQAQSAELGLESGSYEWRPAREGAFAQYRIALPVHGSYPSIRRFVEATLAAAPPVALESLRIARDDIEESVVDAEISFVIYLGDS